MNIKKALEYDQELYSIKFSELVSFEFKLLKIKEFNLFDKLLKGGNMPPFFIYEEIFNLCFIGNLGFLPKTLPIGYIITTGQLIHKLSGGDSGEEFLLNIARERQRQPANSIYEHMKSVILWAFSAISLKDIENMTEKEFIRNFVTAENLLIKTKPDYKLLDLKKIHEEIFETATPEKPTTEARHDHQAMEQELGYWEVKEAEDKFIQEEIERIKAYEKSRS